MKVSVTFVQQVPTAKMWAFAKDMAQELELDLPKYEFDAVHEFINENIDTLWLRRKQRQLDLS